MVGKDDRQFIPYNSISFIEHDRKHLGRDRLHIHIGGKTLQWKVATDAEGFVDAVNQILTS